MHITRTSPEQINVRQDGEWKEIQTDVQGVGFWSFLGIGGGEVPVHPLAPQFAETASDDGVLRVTHQGHKVAYTLEGAGGSKLQRNLGLGERDEVSYGDVFPATDLIYQVQNAGVEQLFRLDEAPGAEGRTSWTWQVDSDELELSKTEDGVIEFRDQNDKVVLMVPPLQAWDSAGQSGTEANVSVGLDTKLSGKGSDWTITVLADRSWLNAKSRTYPVWIDPAAAVVYVDPTYNYRSNVTPAYFNQSIQIGNTGNGYLWRTVAHYNYEQFFGKQILDANLAFEGISADSTPTVRWGELDWASGFSYNGVGHPLGGLYADSSSGYVNDDRLTQQIVDWVNTSGPNGYLMHRGD
ncbi:hypothetical protein J7E25_16270 [Agromyces sp. ISL-38]|uniref:hypothetical protein n=1 Tax=Agromyces sp. ISL-38 TaxID=2819107 RepID=UPI001BEAF489|nr:hypothetical protein [Agromyces sp. ISL-38]MBT2500654.1 hypothetical protein [Agromyces sp. ISL-38]